MTDDVALPAPVRTALKRHVTNHWTTSGTPPQVTYCAEHTPCEEVPCHVERALATITSLEAQIATLREELAWAVRTLYRHDIISDERHAELQALLPTPSTDILARIKAEAVAEFLTVERIAEALRLAFPLDVGDLAIGDFYDPVTRRKMEKIAAALRAALLTENQPVNERLHSDPKVPDVNGRLHSSENQP
jgi:hypothetical protein